MLYTFVNFDNLVNENNEIEAPEGLKDLLVELIDNGYIEDLFGTWWETGNDEEDEWLKEKGIEVKTMKEIADTDPDAKFGFSYGYPEKRLDVTNASGYIEDMGVDYEDYGVTAEDLGVLEDDYYETSSTLDDSDWDETDDPLYGYGEDDFLESKKTSSKRISESEDDEDEEDEDDWDEDEKDFTTEDAVTAAFPNASPHTMEIITKWYENESAIEDFDTVEEFAEFINSDFLEMFYAGNYDDDEFVEVSKDMIDAGYYDEDDFPYDEEDDLDEAVLREDAFTTDVVYVTPHDDPSWYDENGNPVFEPEAYPEIAYATACELQKIADPIFIDYSDGDAESGMCTPEPTGIFKMTVAELKTAIENGNLVEDDIDVYTGYDPETQTVIETSKIEDVLSLVFDAVEPLTEMELLKDKEVAIAQSSDGKDWTLADAAGRAGKNISGVETYKDIKTAKGSKAWIAMIDKFGKENEGKYFRIVTAKDKDIIGDTSSKK